MLERKKSYAVKQWFANKVANEVAKNITMCDVFAVLKETDKAVYAMLNIGCNSKKTMWVPKSALVVNDIETGHYETLFIESYELACKEFGAFWTLFK